MADLSHLGGLNPVEQLDLDGTYQVAKPSTFQLPPKGRYSLQAPEFTPASFGRTGKGALSIQIDPTIVGPTHEGFLVRFVKISAKVFDRKGSKASQVGDYLTSCGFAGVLADEQAIADAVESTSGTVYEAKLDWRAYNKRTGWSLEGMERFPKQADGTYQSWVIDPQEVGKTVDGLPVCDANGNVLSNDDGTPRQQARVLANLTIPFGGFIAPGE